ncbi:endonuclease/exonuclease/phosphatase family protein [Flavobacterium sp. ST-75]|uniref:Endonuclease/exonuclease/phosphatase family protein n=1 Tax=Flavobacterium rhizophilum TaxID=3163296 RepID=A0ABW8YFB2_9FLAO
MKNLSWFNKLMYFINMVLTVLTFLAYVLPFLAPKLFPLLSVFTLILPLLLVLNFFFFMYWLLQTKRQMLLSGLVLLLGITFVSKLYRFSSDKEEVTPDDFVVMSYNVRMFNLYEWIDDTLVPQKIDNFVKERKPDVVCLQEYNKRGDDLFKQFEYRYIYKEKGKSQHAFFSKFPILDTGSLTFPNTGNSVIYADVVKDKDTLRFYSMHLQSVKISPDIHEKIDEEKSKIIFRRLSGAFKEQQLQAEILQQHKKDCHYPMIICGDLNNSAFSYVYRSIRGDLKDSFEEAGSGFGKSYNYKYYPARIDYIFTDNRLHVKEFKTYDMFVNSDHYPIISRLAFVKEGEE